MKNLRFTYSRALQKALNHSPIGGIALEVDHIVGGWAPWRRLLQSWRSNRDIVPSVSRACATASSSPSLMRLLLLRGSSSLWRCRRAALAATTAVAAAATTPGRRRRAVAPATVVVVAAREFLIAVVAVGGSAAPRERWARAEPRPAFRKETVQVGVLQDQACHRQW